MASDEDVRAHRRDATASSIRGVLEGFRVVIVDDDADARDLLTAVLTARLALVFAAESASQAFELVQRERPHVLVSDIAMPEEDGYMLIARVRALSADGGGRTAAIALTAYASRADRTRALDAGFDAHLSKPVDIDALVDALIELRAASLLPKSG